MMIRRIRPGQDGDVRRASSLFGHSLQPDATTKFLASETHHLFIAYEGDEPVGFTTGVEMTHPDKGTEMFPYELEVAEVFRRRGIGAALVTRLEELAKECGCYGMWVLTDGDNTAALRTYQKAGGIRSDDQAMMSWKL